MSLPTVAVIGYIHASGHASPAVGIFWFGSAVLVLNRSLLGEGDLYGECIARGTGDYQR